MSAVGRQRDFEGNGVQRAYVPPQDQVARVVHRETGDAREFTALEFDALRRSGNIDPKDWDVSCPCCGEGTKMSHTLRHNVKTGPETHTERQTHWNLRDGSWHGNPDCQNFDPAIDAYHRRDWQTLYTLSKENGTSLELRVASTTSDNRGVRSIKRAYDGVVSAMGDAHSRSQETSPASLPNFSVSELHAVMATLGPEDSRHIHIKQGRQSRPLSELYAHDMQEFVDLHDAALDRGDVPSNYFVNIVPDFETLEPVSHRPGMWSVRSIPEEVDYDGRSYPATVSLVITDEDVLNLIDGGQLKQGDVLSVCVDAKQGPVDQILFASQPDAFPAQQKV